MAWAVVPTGRQLLRRIAGDVDVMTYLGSYTQTRLARALGRHADRLQGLAPGVDAEMFRPGLGHDVRAALSLSDRPVVVCVSRLMPRKGQDALIRALPVVQRAVPDAAGRSRRGRVRHRVPRGRRLRAAGRRRRQRWSAGCPSSTARAATSSMGATLRSGEAANLKAGEVAITLGYCIGLGWRPLAPASSVLFLGAGIVGLATKALPKRPSIVTIVLGVLSRRGRLGSGSSSRRRSG